MKKNNVLQIVPFLDGGGVENLLLNYYKHLGNENFKFDFIVHGAKKGGQERIFENMGSKIFHIKSKHENIIDNLKSMKKIIFSGDYDVIHVHQGIMGVFPLYYAKKSGIKIRIAHAHKAYEKKSLIQKALDKILLPFLKRYATHWLACSKDAGISLWGEKAVKNDNVIIIKNGIDVEKFKFNEEKRKEKRKELNIENKFVIGSVGRLSYQKNHDFLIDIFNEIYTKNKNSELIIAGSGELETEIRNKIKTLGLEKNVKLLGLREDVNDILLAIDVFVLPSRYEGLGIVYIEAQASGLLSFGSEGVVPHEVKVTDLMEFIPLEKSSKYWANKILNHSNKYERVDTSKEIKLRGYDLDEMIKSIKNIYTLQKL